MLKKILLGIAIVIALVLIWLAVIDGSYDVKRSTVIEASQENVYDVVADLGSWTIWSPWLIMEPDAKVVVKGDAGKVGNFYSWEGELVGSGEMENTVVNRPSSLVQELRFTSPFPSKSTVYWELKPKGAGVEITWGMNGKMPFLFKFMAKQMDPMIGMDYERGLRMLKDYLETGEVISRVELEGSQSKEAFKYIGIKSTVKWGEIGDEMGVSYGKLMTFMESNGVEMASPPISIYHDFGPGKENITFTAAIPYKGDVDVPEEFDSGEYPAGNAFVVSHFGKYEHIGNAWSAGFSATRYKKMKMDGDLDPYEVYITDPMLESDVSKWETLVVLPLK